MATHVSAKLSSSSLPSHLQKYWSEGSPSLNIEGKWEHNVDNGL